MVQLELKTRVVMKFSLLYYFTACSAARFLLAYTVASDFCERPGTVAAGTVATTRGIDSVKHRSA